MSRVACRLSFPSRRWGGARPPEDCLARERAVAIGEATLFCKEREGQRPRCPNREGRAPSRPYRVKRQECRLPKFPAQNRGVTNADNDTNHHSFRYREFFGGGGERPPVSKTPRLPGTKVISVRSKRSRRGAPLPFSASRRLCVRIPGQVSVFSIPVATGRAPPGPAWK